MRFPIERLPLAVPVGVQTESGVEEIGFDIAEWLREWPEMECTVWLTRPGESSSYPAGGTKMDGTVLIWTPDGYDTAIPGSGKIEVLGLTPDGEHRKLTGPRATLIQSTTLASTSEPGAAEKPWVDKVLDAAKTVEALLNFPTGSSGQMVYIGPDGKLTPLVLGAGLEIVDGVLRVTYTPAPNTAVEFVEQEDGSVLMQGVTFAQMADGSIMWQGAKFTEQEDGSYLIS